MREGTEAQRHLGCIWGVSGWILGGSGMDLGCIWGVFGHHHHHHHDHDDDHHHHQLIGVETMTWPPPQTKYRPQCTPTMGSIWDLSPDRPHCLIIDPMNPHFAIAPPPDLKQSEDATIAYSGCMCCDCGKYRQSRRHNPKRSPSWISFGFL